MGSVYIGTSGFSYREWKGKFYPEDLPKNGWLAYYAERFPTVEINAEFSMLRLVRPSTNDGMTRLAKTSSLRSRVIAISPR